MNKSDTVKQIREVGLLAVLRGPAPELTVRMVEALVKGGVTGIEITYSTPQAAWVVSRLREQFGEQILLGMGTLRHEAQAAEACQAGASFLVSPHCKPELAQAMTATGLAVVIGALTPTEVEAAWSLGADVVKLFPGSLGGPAYLKALHAPFPDIPLMPTGGVRLENLAEWFAAGAVAVGAGSELCPPQLAQVGRFDEITALARQFCQALQRARGAIQKG